MHYHAKKSCNSVIDKYLSGEEILGEDNTITTTVKFDNGFEMDVKCCGSQDGTAWTEAVLFDENGHEATMTDPSDEFFGEWIIEYEPDTYHAEIERRS